MAHTVSNYPTAFYIPELSSLEARKGKKKNFEIEKETISEIGATLLQEGLKLVRTASSYPRDYLIEVNGKTLIPNAFTTEEEKRLVQQCDEWAYNWSVYSGLNAQTDLNRRCDGLQEGPWETVYTPKSFRDLRFQFSSKEADWADVPLKGGNIIFSKGCAFVSKHQFNVFFEYLIRSKKLGFLKPPEQMKLTDEKIRKVARRMFLTGKLEKKPDPLATWDLLTEACIQNRKDPSVSILRQLKNQLKIPELVVEHEEIVMFLHAEKVAKDLLAKLLGVDSLLLVPSMSYHLDFSIAAGPDNKIFIQDHEASLLTLRLIDEKKLPPSDLPILKQLLETAEASADAFQKKTEEIAEIVFKAGFEPIRTPGTFFCSPIGEEPLCGAIHFLNAIFGQSPKDREHYFITSKVKIGEKLGAALMASFEDFVLEHLPRNTRIHFVGRGEDLFTNTGPQAGPRCYTSPIFTSQEESKKD